jgi:hypothetical protein
LLNRLELEVGDSVAIKLSLPGLLRGGRLIERYQSFESREEYVVDSPDLDVEKVSKMIYELVSPRGKEYNINITEADVKEVVQEVYDTEFTLSYHIKYEYHNRGLYPTTLHNVVLMEFEGFADFLTQLITKKVLESRQIEQKIFDLLKTTDMPSSQILILRTYYRSLRSSKAYEGELRKNVQ